MKNKKQRPSGQKRAGSQDQIQGSSQNRAPGQSRENPQGKFSGRSEGKLVDKDGKHHPISRAKFQDSSRSPSSTERGASGKSFSGRGPSAKGHSDRGPSGRRQKSSRRAGMDQKGHEYVTLKATVDKNRKGFAFLIFENKKVEDAYVFPEQAANLFHGDRVEVQLSPSGKPKNIRVIEHRFREMVGKFRESPSPQISGGYVVYERKKGHEEVYIPQIPTLIRPRPLQNNDWIFVKLNFAQEGSGDAVTAEILDVYGPTLPPSADIVSVSAEYNLTEAHSQKAEIEAMVLKEEFTRDVASGKHLKDREDLTHLPWITIDGANARDFDDAIYVEATVSGFVLWVGIADVSYYVIEGSALDDEARARGTSVYFPERAFHMLPSALSENLCSLRPKEPRMAMVTKIRYDVTGKRLEVDVMEAVIESKRRATYEEIQAESDQNKGQHKWEYAPHFSLYAELKKMRSERGSIDFELPEAEVLTQPSGEVISIKNRPRLDAHRLIEEFMIAANEAVTDWMMAKKLPFIYRIHEEPSAKGMEKFQVLTRSLGLKIPLQALSSPKTMSDVLKKMELHPAKSLLNMTLLRSLKQAIYSSVHNIHYGLASPGYTHFTSPIRRYPDLVVHRLLRGAIRSRDKKDEQKRAEVEKQLTAICEHCSYRERLASDAERESIKVKQVRFMQSKLGEDFDAVIVNLVPSGIFAQIRDPYVDGLIPLESLTDDFYEFNEEQMYLIGRRKKKKFKVGDSCSVKVVRADLDRRQIEFAMI